MFHNAIMLAGLGAAVLPVVLHLLSRTRYRDVQWGAMMFLDSTDRKQAASSRFKQWTLLMIRMLLIATLAIALARPVSQTHSAEAGSAGARIAIVLDRSASMSVLENDRPRFDLAREVARQILESLRPGDEAALILADQAGPSQDLPMTGDWQLIARRLAELTVSRGASDIPAALERAAALLNDDQVGLKELYVIGDRQRIAWAGLNNLSADDPALTALRERLSGVRAQVVPVGTNGPDNIAIESIELLNAPAIAQQNLDLEVRLLNYGDIVEPAWPLKLSVGGREVIDATVNLGASGVATFRATVPLRRTGSQLITASIKPHGLAHDDQFELAVQVIPPIDTLIVSGDERPGLFRGESDFLRLALAPRAFSRKGGDDPVKLSIARAESWSAVELEKHQVIILANVPQLSTAQARALERFVYNGGGLLIAPGNLSRVENYNLMLHRGGEGVMPAPLDPPTSADGSLATTLLGIELSHPVFRFLRGRPDPIPIATIGRYFPVDRRAEVIASFADGRPFLVESRLGRGRVLLMTTPLDADWSTLPLSHFYLPFVQNVVRHLAIGATPPRNLLLGESIVRTVDGAIDERSMRLELPDGSEQRPAVTRLGDRTEMRYGPTEQFGTHRLRYAEGRNTIIEHFVVRGAAAESDAASLTEQDWQRIAESLGLRRLDLSQRTIQSAMSESRRQREWWGWLLACVLALGGLDLLLSRWWSRGLP